MILQAPIPTLCLQSASLILLEKNIPHTYLVDAPNDPASQVARVNPLGRIPALILDDETCASTIRR